MKEIIFFSNNQNKIIEINTLFHNSPFKILNLNNFKKIKSPKESGKTFEENSKIKSSYGHKILKTKCFADDSGICIKSMKNKPGVQSKRFIEKNVSILNALEKILAFVHKSKNNEAFFQTSVCLSLDKNRHIFFNGIIKGFISKKIRGNNGFGYDPIFIPENHDKTFAEMSIEEKNLFSHRSIAVRKLKKYLFNLV